MDYDGMDPSDTIKILIDETSDVWINVCWQKFILRIDINWNFISKTDELRSRLHHDATANTLLITIVFKL